MITDQEWPLRIDPSLITSEKKKIPCEEKDITPI
jgi:hypothetical protein